MLRISFEHHKKGKQIGPNAWELVYCGQLFPDGYTTKKLKANGWKFLEEDSLYTGTWLDRWKSADGKTYIQRNVWDSYPSQVMVLTEAEFVTGRWPPVSE